MVRVLCLTLALVLVGSAVADTHHNAHQKLGNKINTNGRHVLHQGRNGHVAHAHVNNGKVTEVRANHRGKSLKVTKYKSSKRHHAGINGEEHYYASETAEPNQGAIAFIGFGFVNQVTGQLVIFWFPIALVQGGDDGATDYGNSCT